MADNQPIAAKCPTCGAGIAVPRGASTITCRYCQSDIPIEHRRPPPEVIAAGGPGAMPSRVLFLDPNAAAKQGRAFGRIIVAVCVLPALLPLLFTVGPWAYRKMAGSVRPFPASCAANEQLELSGEWEGPGPILTSVGPNCKIHIKGSRLKGATLVTGEPMNLELTLDDTLIETTDTMIQAGVNLNVRMHGTTLKSAATVFDTDSNFELVELTGGAIESTAGIAIRSKYNLKIKHADGVSIRGKKGAIDTDANLELSMKNNSQITSSDGVAIKTTSSFKLDAEGGRIDGAEAAIVTTSGTTIRAQRLVVGSAKGSAIRATSGLTIELTDGSITSAADAAIDAESGIDLVLANATVQGAEAAVMAKGPNLKVKATKKTRLVATTGDGILASMNPDVTLTDASIEGAHKGLKGGVNMKLKLGAGARIAGKKGGVEADTNLELDGNGAIIDGGSGPGIMGQWNARIGFREGSLRGVPALVTSRKPMELALDGTKIDGAVKVGN